MNNEDQGNFNKTDNISYITKETISLGAALAIGALLVAPAFMAVLAMFKRNIDFTMSIYLPMIKHLVFPFACSVVLIIYIITIIKLNKNGADLIQIFKSNPVFVIFLMAVAMMLGSQLYNGADYAFSGFGEAALGETFGMELSYFIFILFGAAQIKVEKHKRLLLRLHLISSAILVLAAFILWHTQTESVFFGNWYERFSSIFSNSNYYGYYLAVSVPAAGAAFIYEKNIKWKVFSGVAFAANTVALSINNSFGSWIGAGCAVLFIAIAHLIIEKKINWQAIAVIFVFAVCLYVPGKITGSFENNFSTLAGDMDNIILGDESNVQNERWSIWKASLDIVNENKFYGIGFEGVLFWEYVGPPWNIRPHNEFIQYAMFHGIPMAFMYFIGCLGVFIRALRKRKIMNGATLVCLAGAFGYLVGSFFGLTVFSTGYFLFAFLGMGYVNDTVIPQKDYKENVNIEQT